MKILRSLKSILWFVLLAGVLCHGQALNPADAQFVQDFGTDSINLQNLSVGISAPVISKPGALPFSYSLYATPQCWSYWTGVVFAVACANSQNKSSVLPGLSSAGHWSSGYTSTGADTFCTADNQSTTYYTGLYVISPEGTAYYLPTNDKVVIESGGGTSCKQTVTDYTLTGGLKVTLTGFGASLSSVVFPNGTTFTPGAPDIYTDAFGNTLKFNINTGIFTDSLATTALTVTKPIGATGEIDTYTDTTGASQQVKQIFTSKTVKTAFGCSGKTDENTTGYVTTEIDYPDGVNIYLAYEPITGGVTGRIWQITLRTGGNVNYTYGAINSCVNFIPSTLTRSTVDGTTTYTFAMNGTHGTQTTVLDPGKNKTVYLFQGTDANGLPQFGIPLTLTQVQVFKNNGTVAAPSYTSYAQSTTLYCYNGNTASCATTQAAYPITQKDVYVTPDNKTTSARTKYTFDTYGNMTSVARYDFGAGTPDTTTTITYGSWNGSCVAVGSSIINLPCDVKTTDSAGHTLAETRHTYSSKGFETQTQTWSNNSFWITASASPNANGTVNTSTSPTGAVTTYSYDCNSLLPIGTSTSGAIPLTTGATVDCNTGKVMSSWGPNGGPTSAYQFTYDPMLRPFTQTDPLGYQVSETYTATTTTVSDQYGSTTTRVDGLGRPIRTQTTDGASYDTVSTGYGFNGTQFQVSTSEPCLAALNADCTKVHFSTLDPLGRGISSNTTSNETLTTSYNQNDVQTTLSPAPSGENTKTVQTERDGLGRIKSICALALPGVNGSVNCGQLDGNTGILTGSSYAYSTGLTSVTTTRGSQSHTSYFEAAGRLIQNVTPEAGTVTYYWDSITTPVCGSQTSNGQIVKKSYNDGSYECYDHDTRGRLTDIGSADASGTQYPVCKRLRYDGLANVIYAAPPGYSATNVVGRLIEASTDDCTFPYSQAHMITDEWFAYDEDGQLTDVWEKTPNSNGWYHTTVAYSPNGVPVSISGIPGRSTYTIGLDLKGRPDTSTYGTTSVATNVNYNAAGQPTEVDYGADNDKYTYDTNTGRMKTWAFKVGTPTQTGTLTWDADGTLGTLAINDGFNAGGTQTCTFSYDDIVRLLTDNCGTVWNQSYSYDQYDNLTKSGSGGWAPGYNATNNRMQNGSTYDANGNVTYDTHNSYGWDPYGKMITVNAGSSLGSCGAAGVTCVTYDAFGNAVEKNVAGAYTQYLYSPIGLSAVMNGQTTNHLRMPIPGGGLFVFNGNNIVDHRDWLGSTRLAHVLGGAVNRDIAYTPYGETYANVSGSGLTLDFAGMYTDLFSGLFDTPNREFDASAGSRWLSPDPAHASWNAYAYPTNPNSMTDPSGLEGECDGGDGCGPVDDGPGPNPGGDGLQAMCNNDGGPAAPCADITDYQILDTATYSLDELSVGPAGGASSDWGSSDLLVQATNVLSGWDPIAGGADSRFGSVNMQESAGSLARLVAGTDDDAELRRLARDSARKLVNRIVQAQAETNIEGKAVAERIWNWYAKATNNFADMGPYFNHYATKIAELAEKEGPYQADAIAAGNAWMKDGVDVQNAILDSGNLSEYFNNMGVPKYEVNDILRQSYKKRGLYFGVLRKMY